MKARDTAEIIERSPAGDFVSLRRKTVLHLCGENECSVACKFGDDRTRFANTVRECGSAGQAQRHRP